MKEWDPAMAIVTNSDVKHEAGRDVNSGHDHRNEAERQLNTGAWRPSRWRFVSLMRYFLTDLCFCSRLGAYE